LLLHITSLPGRGPCGDLGREAFAFVDFLVDAGFGVWQMLPVGPTGSDGSPYQSSCTHAGNTRFIALEPLVEAGWLDPRDLDCCMADDRAKAETLTWVYGEFRRQSSDEQLADFEEFSASHAHWLDDYALFVAVNSATNAPWWQWPAGLRDRDPQALTEAQALLAKSIAQIQFEQYVFFDQWRKLRAYAGERGIKLFGDLPIFVALNSAEVWANREQFFLDETGEPTVVAGVPPDYFSATGQRWGNPLYRWDVMEANGFSFWVDRLRTQLELFDFVRIDHFRGFEAYWEIPATEPNAIHGRWVPGPGDRLFDRLREALGQLPLVAEDLGLITDEVQQLRDRLGMPGMKILQFAFSGGPDNPYLPFRHPENSLVYTGTHDNNTTLGWYADLTDDERRVVDEYLGHPRDPMPWPLVQCAMMSPARLAIVPMQDALGLDGEHRMNLPGSIEGNWGWRFRWEDVPPELKTQLRHLVWMTGRCN
jgi:4-alpha-glucanotransferase